MAIMSKIDRVSHVHFVPGKTGKVVKVQRALILEEGQGAILENADGTYTVVGTGSTVNKYALSGFGVVYDYTKGKAAEVKLDHFATSILNGLAALGIISKKDVRDHLDQQIKRAEERNRNQCAKDLLALCDRLGIEAPKLPAGVDPAKTSRFA